MEDGEEDRVVQRIRKLMALAEIAESPNQHEAEAAATAACKLMLRFNIDVERDDPRSEQAR